MVSARPRDRILTTATELFHAEGIGAVGVNRIIGQADVAPMTLYRQFGGKDALVAATLEQWSAQWLHRLADAMDRRGDDPSDRFDGLWDELQAWFDADGFRGSFVANAATELRSEPDHPAQARIVQHRQPCASSWRTWPRAPAPTTRPSSPPSSSSCSTGPSPPPPSTTTPPPPPAPAPWPRPPSPPPPSPSQPRAAPGRSSAGGAG